jgi:hypothetical protein
MLTRLCAWGLCNDPMRSAARAIVVHFIIESFIVRLPESLWSFQVDTIGSPPNTVPFIGSEKYCENIEIGRCWANWDGN